MQIPPVSNEQISMMNINLNAMALELQQRRAVMPQQEAQIKELARKVAEAESNIVELEQKAVSLSQTILKYSSSIADRDGMTGEEVAAMFHTDDEENEVNVKPADPGEELDELDIDGLNLQERTEAYERQKAMIKAAYLPGEPPISRPGKVVLVDSDDEVTNAGDQT